MDVSEQDGQVFGRHEDLDAARYAGLASDETCTFEGEDKGRLELVEGSGHFIQNERPQRLIEGALQAARETGADMSECQSMRRGR